MLYERDLNAASFYQAKLKNIARRLLADKCMFFLGAAASLTPPPSLPIATLPPLLPIATPPPPPPSLPTANELSQEMATQCQLDWHEYIPLSTIAFYYESYFTRDDLNDLLIKRIQRNDIEPSPAIRKLMQIIRVLEARGQSTYSITTNYDEQFERAYKAEFNTDPEVIIYQGAHDPLDKAARLNCRPQGPLLSSAQLWRPKKRSVLYKMHGSISQTENKGLVITEEDYINFLANALGERDPEKTLLGYIMAELSARTVLFIGYSLSDWNFRAIFKATVEKYATSDSRSYAIQFTDPNRVQTNLDKAKSQSLATFWHEKRVDILNADAATLVDDLIAAIAAEEPLLPKERLQHAEL